MMLVHYDTKEHLQECIGERLRYSETSMFGKEYLPTGTFLVAHRPILQGSGREYFAKVTMIGDLISKVV